MNKKYVTLEKDHIENIFDINRKQKTLKVKLNIDLEKKSKTRKHWLVLYFASPASATIPNAERTVIHQNWELEGIIYNESDKSLTSYYYLFTFVGMPFHDTMQYDGNQILLPPAPFHDLIKETIDNNPALAEQLNDTRGLEHLQLMQLPGSEEYFIGMKMNQ